MSVIAPGVVKNMIKAMIEPDEQMSSCGATMSEDHPACGSFLPTIGCDIAKKLISTNLNRAVGIQRHFIGLA